MTPQKDWLENDYYKILGVPETATQKEITAAYRKLAKKYHPDVSSGSEDLFKKITAAHNVLSDPKTRAEYDQIRKLGATGGAGPGGFSGSFRIDDLSDLFGGIFNTRFGNKNARQYRGTGPQRGEDIVTNITLKFEEAIKGVTTSINLDEPVTCPECRGTRVEKGSKVEVCPTCKGKGSIDTNQGLFSLSQICPQCSGAGEIITKPCRRCSGRGTVYSSHPVTIRIPPGVEDGGIVRLRHKGRPGKNGGPNGDVIIKVSVLPHPIFARSGNNLLVAVPISFAEAALGATIEVPTLGGEIIKIKVPAGTQNGKVFRIPKRGVQTKNGTGDLLASVIITVPKKLSEKERRALQALREAENGSVREQFLAGIRSS